LLQGLAPAISGNKNPQSRHRTETGRGFIGLSRTREAVRLRLFSVSGIGGVTILILVASFLAGFGYGACSPETPCLARQYDIGDLP
jgi:hypothetical protein